MKFSGTIIQEIESSVGGWSYWALHIIFRRSRVRISVRRPEILTEIFRRYLHADAGILPQNRLQPLPPYHFQFTIYSHPTIRYAT